MMPDVMKLNGARLITARHQRGWNQTELARRCGLTIQTISGAENGKDVYPATGDVICSVLGLNLKDVVVPTEKAGDGDAA